ncbi:MAG: PD-(D/E)XK nuclease family protein [Elusimicrobia bacterium]|nr:PD-(D/E)XK nuclease family protein [Candidatus Liberimonas magnetica]
MDNSINDFEQRLSLDKDFAELRNNLKMNQNCIFNIICKENDELTFSRVMKYLLDPLENHGLKDAFLKEFLSYLKNKYQNNSWNVENVDLNNAKVYKEYFIGDSGRLDVFIECKGNQNSNLYIIIENKIDSSENEYSIEGKTLYQTEIYSQWIDKKYSSSKNIILKLFVTPKGIDPKSSKFASIPFSDIAAVIKKLKPSDENISYLLKNILCWIEEVILMDDKLKPLCNQIYKKYKEEFDTIIQFIPKTADFIADIAEKLDEEKYNIQSGTSWITVNPIEWGKKYELWEGKKYTIPRISVWIQNNKMNISFVTKQEGPTFDWFNNSEQIFMKKELKSTEGGNNFYNIKDEEDFIINEESLEEDIGRYVKIIESICNEIFSKITDKDISKWKA